MIGKQFFKAGHTLTLFAAFFYFDMAFMVWVILGPLGVQIATDLGLNAGQKGLMVAVPILAGALLRVVNGVLVDHIKPKLTGLIGQLVVLAGLLLTWFVGVHSFTGILALGIVLGVAGASFAVALPLASRWDFPRNSKGSPSDLPELATLDCLCRAVCTGTRGPIWLDQRHWTGRHSRRDCSRCLSEVRKRQPQSASS